MTFVAVPIEQPGNAAGVVILSEVAGGYCVLNTWIWDMGGNGVELTLAGNTVMPDESSVLFVVMAIVRYHHGAEPDSYGADVLELVALQAAPHGVSIRLRERMHGDASGNALEIRLVRTPTAALLTFDHDKVRAFE